MAFAQSRPLDRHPLRRWFAAGAAVALLALLTLVFSPGTAGAENPFRLPTQITDTAGALDSGQRSDVQNALDTLYEEHQVQLWVVFVPNFDNLDGRTWAERTAQISGLGNRDALLAVATVDHAYYIDVPQSMSEVTDAEIASIDADAVEPALREEDWAGAAIAAAGGLGDAMTPPGGSGLGRVLLIGGGVVVVGVGGLYLYSRKKKADHVKAAAEAAKDIEPNDTAALATLPTPALDARAKDVLIETDNAVRTSGEELDLARGEFGDEATAPFTAAFEQARVALASAFTLRQRLDDDIPETPEQRRDMLIQIISTCGKADQQLNARVAEFDGMRDLLLGAPDRLDSLTRQMVELTVRVPKSEATLTALRTEFPAPALASVEQNITLARQQLAFAEQNITAGRDATALPAGKQGPAVGAIRAAEAALGQATALLDAIDRAATDIRNAITTLPAAMDDVAQGIAAAGPLAQQGGERLSKARAAAEAALENAKTAKESDPLGSFTRIVEADAELDAVLAEAQEARQQAERARQRLDQDLTAAKSQVAAAADFITTRRGAVGAEARTRLSEAQRNLQAAEDLASTDPSQALQHAKAASDLGAQALYTAQNDVVQWESSRRPPSSGSGGGNATGAVLGGILIDSILRGGFGGGGNWGSRGGFGGDPGHRGPGSFGGPSSSGRIGRGSGGRF